MALWPDEGTGQQHRKRKRTHAVIGWPGRRKGPTHECSLCEWLTAIRRYLFIAVCGNVVWELAQLPLYTLWYEGTARSITYAWLHCAAGDVIITSVSLMASLAVIGRPGWPNESSVRVGTVVLAIGIGYTIFSEYDNTVVRQSWSYTEWMPTLPWVRTGLAPLVQWVVVPMVALIAVKHS